MLDRPIKWIKGHACRLENSLHCQIIIFHCTQFLRTIQSISRELGIKHILGCAPTSTNNVAVSFEGAVEGNKHNILQDREKVFMS